MTSLWQKLKSNKPKKKNKVIKKTPDKSTDKLAVRANNIIKPQSEARTDLIIPHRFDINHQTATSVLRNSDYIKPRPRKALASQGGEL